MPPHRRSGPCMRRRAILGCGLILLGALRLALDYHVATLVPAAPWEANHLKLSNNNGNNNAKDTVLLAPPRVAPLVPAAPWTANHAKRSSNKGSNNANTGSVASLLQEITVVAVIPQQASKYERRVLQRRAFAEVSEGIVVRGHPVQVVQRFLVGQPPREEYAAHKQRLIEESCQYDDIVMIDVKEGSMKLARRKSWHVFEWAGRHYPTADMIFKQDYDTFVNWPVFIPLLIEKAFVGRDLELPLQHFYAGRKHAYGFNIGSGTLYGVSGDVAAWMQSHTAPFPPIQDEDMSMINCMKKYDRHAKKENLPKLVRAFLDPMDKRNANASIQNVKKDAVFRKCFEDRVNGCNNGKTQGVVDGFEHMLLAPRTGGIATVEPEGQGSCSNQTANSVYMFFAQQQVFSSPPRPPYNGERLAVLTSGHLVRYTAESTLQHVIRANANRGFKVDYFVGLNKEPYIASEAPHECPRYVRDPMFRNLTGGKFVQTLCERAEEMGGGHCDVRLLRRVVVKKMPSGGYHDNRLTDYGKSETQRHSRLTFSRWAKVLDEMWLRVLKHETDVNMSYTRIMVVYDSAWWYGDARVDQLRAPPDYPIYFTPSCGENGGINDKILVLTRESAQRIFPIYEALIKDKSLMLVSARSNDFLENLADLRHLEKTRVSHNNIPTNPARWTTDSYGNLSQCLVKSPCVRSAADPPTCCEGEETLQSIGGDLLVPR